ncbi:hypothetical protein ACL2XP_25340 [Sodalis sp. RH21]|uniref:hypothetical protein n=1 Tax=unclassified Sodalis (in: enterobacteria) TaxID=2636512 RepID=UPI0039B4EC9B
MSHFASGLQSVKNKSKMCSQLFLSLAKVAAAGEELCMRTGFIKFIPLLKSVRNIAGVAARIGFFLVDIPDKGISSAYSRWQCGANLRGRPQPRLANLLYEINASHIPEYIRAVTDPQKPGATVSLIAQVAIDICDISGTRNQKIPQFFKGVKTTADMFTAFKGSINSLLNHIKVSYRALGRQLAEATAAARTLFADKIALPLKPLFSKLAALFNLLPTRH